MEEKQEYAAIEELKLQHGTPDPVFCGVMAMQGWKSGKTVTGKEYEKAVEKFLKAPADGRKTGTEVRNDVQ